MTVSNDRTTSADCNYASLFEKGVKEYFRDFGHRQARESPHQAWLLISVAKHIPAQFIVAELQVPNQDLSEFVRLKNTNGAVNFDFAVSRSEIDLRTWKSQTDGWKNGAKTVPQTRKTLESIEILAEFKIAGSTSTTRSALVHDIRKLAAAIQFMNHNDCTRLPMCYFIVLDPDRRINVETLAKLASKDWPQFAPFPKIIVGPNIRSEHKRIAT